VSAEPNFPAEAGGLEGPPRKNGELVFEAPWEARAFGIGIALAQQGIYSLPELRERLIHAIASWQSTHAVDDASWSYYECWLRAVEDLMSQRVHPVEIDDRMWAVAKLQPHDHDGEYNTPHL
jgi:nitrile hydratase accessory protein